MESANRSGINSEKLPLPLKEAVQLFTQRKFKHSLELLEQLLSSGELSDKDRRLVEGLYQVIDGTRLLENYKLEEGFKNLRAGYIKLKTFYPRYKDIYLAKFLEVLEDSLLELRTFIK